MRDVLRRRSERLLSPCADRTARRCNQSVAWEYASERDSGPFQAVTQASLAGDAVKKLPALISVSVAMFLIAALELYALNQGVNGTFFSLSVVEIGMLAGGFAGFRIKK